MVIYYAAKTDVKKFRLGDICLAKEKGTLNQLHLSADVSLFWEDNDGYSYGRLNGVHVNMSDYDMTFESLKDTVLVDVWSNKSFEFITVVLVDGDELMTYTMWGVDR